MNSTMVNHQQDEQGCQVPVWENGETVGSWQNTLLLLWWPLSCIGKWQQTRKRRQYAPTKVTRNGRKARPNTDMPSIWDKTYMAKSSECWFAYGSKPENTNWSTWPSTLVWIPGARRSAGVYFERPHELLSRCMAGRVNTSTIALRRHRTREYVCHVFQTPNKQIIAKLRTPIILFRCLWLVSVRGSSSTLIFVNSQ